MNRLILTAIIGILSALALTARTPEVSAAAPAPTALADSLALADRNRPCDGMYFTTENVTEEYEYDDAYCVSYTDPDADLYEAEICLDLKTYRAVRAAIAKGVELYGELHRVDSLGRDEVEVYTLKPLDF